LFLWRFVYSLGRVRVTKVMAEAEFIQRTMNGGKVPPSYRELTAVTIIEPDQVKV
jgi:hypothetical protein